MSRRLGPALGEAIPVRKSLEVCGESKPFEVLVAGPTGGVKDTVFELE